MTSHNPAKQNFKVHILFFSVLIGGISFLLGATLDAFFAISLSSYFFLNFLVSLGNIIPIIELMLIICSLQWLVGPVLTYAGLSNHPKYYMYISEQEYIPFVIYGIFAFVLGTLLFKKKEEQQFKSHFLVIIKNKLNANPRISYWLIGFGWICSLLQRFMPGSLSFIFFLLANSMYIGVIYLLFQSSRYKWWVTSIILFFLFLSSLQSSMFHSLLLWLTFIGLYIFAIKNISLSKKLLFLVIGLVFVYLIQVTKWEIRRGTVAGNLSGFVGIVSNSVLGNDDYEDTDNSTEDFIVRLNQGWIISRIMYHIPSESPFVNGETVNDAISAALLPRFLNPGKTLVGGQEYFEKFTGFSLRSSTSMGASLLGEGYANYGYFGAIIFMFVIGMVYRFVINLIYRIAGKYPTIILWLPLIFLQVVKAESDLIRVLNHLVKASILVFLIYWVCYKVLRVRI